MHTREFNKLHREFIRLRDNALGLEADLLTTSRELHLLRAQMRMLERGENALDTDCQSGLS